MSAHSLRLQAAAFPPNIYGLPPAVGLVGGPPTVVVTKQQLQVQLLLTLYANSCADSADGCLIAAPPPRGVECSLAFCEGGCPRAGDCDRHCAYCVRAEVPLSATYIMELAALLDYPIERLSTGIAGVSRDRWDLSPLEIFVTVVLAPAADGQPASPSTAEGQRRLAALLTDPASALYYARERNTAFPCASASNLSKDWAFPRGAAGSWRSLLPPGLKPAIPPPPPPPPPPQVTFDTRTAPHRQCGAPCLHQHPRCPERSCVRPRPTRGEKTARPGRIPGGGRSTRPASALGWSACRCLADAPKQHNY